MPIGKHIGRTMADIVETDPGYVRWVADNVADSCRNSQ
jgi:hypothetical protein